MMKASDMERNVTVARQFIRKQLCQHELPPTIVGYDNERRQLRDILWRTVSLGESNSLLLIGPRGAGKTMLVNSVVNELQGNCETKDNFIVVQLSGLLQKDDKISLKEITQQMELENVVVNKVFGSFAENLQFLLEALKAGGVYNKSVVFIVDEFDLFTQHHNQTLLYNLFDVAQSAQAPICVVGLTARLDVTELLEKRVKSRFSHRQIHVCPSFTFDDYMNIVNTYLTLPGDASGLSHEFIEQWNERVQSLSGEPAVIDVLRQQFNIDPNIRALKTFLLVPVCRVNIDRPLLYAAEFVSSFKLLHMTDSRAAMLNGLSLLELCLIIAMKHLVEMYDAEPFNFEMVFAEYQKFCKHRSSVQLFDKVVVMKSFEHLCTLELVRCVNDSGVASQRTPAEYRLMTLHVDPSQIIDSLQKFTNCPTDIRQWAASTVTA